MRPRKRLPIVATPGYRKPQEVAGMGNYDYFLTVQELIDLVVT